MAAAHNPTEVGQAAPQLPGWLQSVDWFTPARTAAMGLGLFLFDPIDLACGIVAALTIVLSSDTSVQTQAVVIAGFIAVASASVVVPLVILQIRGDDATELLERARSWIAGNPHVVKALLLVAIAVMQLSKGLETL